MTFTSGLLFVGGGPRCVSIFHFGKIFTILDGRTQIRITMTRIRIKMTRVRVKVTWIRVKVTRIRVKVIRIRMRRLHSFIWLNMRSSSQRPNGHTRPVPRNSETSVKIHTCPTEQSQRTQYLHLKHVHKYRIFLSILFYLIIPYF